MAQNRSAKQLAKLINYILERRPDEFGLVLDQNGYVKIKELLKAIHEEDGWKHIRRSHLDEIMITLSDPPFELSENLIRARHRQRLPEHVLVKDLPKLLYTCIRQKAYPYVADKGLSPLGAPFVILSSTREMAERIGKRIDQAPILLTVNVQQSLANGVAFLQAGEALYLTDFIPANCFTGPPLPKDKPLVKKPVTADIPAQQRPAGSFFVNMDDWNPPPNSAAKMSLKTKLDPKKIKKHKRKRQRPPWRR